MYCSSPNEEKRHKGKNSRSFRQKLQKQFDKESPKTSCLPSFGTSGTTPSSNMEERNPTERSILTSLSNLSDTKKVFRTSAEKISKTFNNVRTSIGSFSQVSLNEFFKLSSICFELGMVHSRLHKHASCVRPCMTPDFVFRP